MQNMLLIIYYSYFRFVNLMEGHIWIESEGLGKGCTVTFIVKLQLPEQFSGDMQQQQLTLPAAPLSNMWGEYPLVRVLAVDDNP